MLTPLILFLGLTVATAVIAHWSDNLGKKLGKKRVSLFGLRPRTTATILTVASSWGIMLFTLVVLLVTSVPLRNALFSYDRERAESQRAQKQADAQIEATHERLTATQTQYNSAKGQLETARGDLLAANLSVKNSQQAAIKAKSATQKAVAAGKNAEAAARQRIREAQKRVANAQKRFLVAQARERAALAKEAAAQNDTRSAESETRGAQQLTRIAAVRLKASRADLKREQGNLKMVRSERDSASRERFAAQKEAFTAQKEAHIASRQVRATKLELAQLQQKSNALQTLSEVLMSSNTPVKVKQTFAAQTIRANQSPQLIAVQLRALLRQAQESFDNIEDISPRFPPNTKLQMVPLPDIVNGKIVYLTPYQAVLQLARSIAAGREDNSVRVVAVRNVLAGENQIEVRFDAVPVAPAFASGEILAAATIDGAQEDWRIFRSLQDLLILGQQRAETVGVMPPFLPEEPYFYASGTNVRIFAALRAIESRKKRLQVNLVAYKALSTVEPLQVRFEVEGLGAPDASATPAPSDLPAPVPTSPTAPAVPTS